jgi:DNA-binding NtrC family response regulator
MSFSLRLHVPEPDETNPQGSGSDAAFIGPEGRIRRLSILVTYGGWRSDDFADQLPRVLGPVGVECHRIGSAAEATDFLRRTPVHIAIVDLSIPMDAAARDFTPAGSRVLALLRRLEQPPPTVVVRPRQPSLRDSGRSLSDALREGAFTVMDGPVPLERMLQVLHRVVHRHYRDRWPAA